MNLAWHIVRKDAGRLWIPVVLWLALLTAKHVVDWRVLHVVTEDGMWVQRMRISSLLIFLLQVFVGYVLAGAWVLEDPAEGTSFFWKTRPIAGAQMLGAKLLGCFLFFVVLPVLISLPWWIANDVYARGIAPAFSELVVWQISITAAAVVVASFSENLGRFLGWSLVFPALIALITIIHGKLTLQSLLTLGTAEKLFSLVALASLGGAVYVQYQTRQKRIAVGMLAAGAVVALTILFQA